MKKKNFDIFTPAEIRAFALDGTVSSMHEYLRKFVGVLQARSRKRKISDRQFRAAIIKAFVSEAFMFARIDFSLEGSLKIISQVVNDEAKFQQDEGWTGKALLK